MSKKKAPEIPTTKPTTPAPVQIVDVFKPPVVKAPEKKETKAISEDSYSYPKYHKFAPVRYRAPGEGAILPTGKNAFDSFSDYMGKASSAKMTDQQGFEAYKRDLDMMKDVHGTLTETQWESLLMNEQSSIDTTISGGPSEQYKDWLLRFNWHDSEQARQHFQELHPNIINNDPSWRQGLGTLRSNRGHMPTLAKAQAQERKLREQEKNRFGF